MFVVVNVIGVLRGIPLAEILMLAISQVVGMVPEGLPVAMTIALAVGVQRMARRNAVVRRLAAVETLGSTTVICSDKTGTLTKNEMTATAVCLPSGRILSVTGAGYEPVGQFFDNGIAVDPTRERIPCARYWKQRSYATMRNSRDRRTRSHAGGRSATPPK